MFDLNAFVLNPAAGQQVIQQLSGGGGDPIGTVCPDSQNNPDMPGGVTCHSCTQARTYYKLGDNDERYKEIAKTLIRKKKPIALVTFLDEPGKVYIAVLPQGVGDTLINALYPSDPNAANAWPNIIHPINGCPLVITKRKDTTKNQMSYSVQPKFNPPANELPLGGDINPATSMQTATQILQQASAFDINRAAPLVDSKQIGLPIWNYASMKEGSSRAFRLIPNIYSPTMPPIRILMTHYEITRDECLNGINPSRLQLPVAAPAGQTPGQAPGCYTPAPMGNAGYAPAAPPMPVPGGLPTPGGASYTPPAGMQPPMNPMGAPAPMMPPMGAPAPAPAGFTPPNMMDMTGGAPVQTPVPMGAPAPMMDPTATNPMMQPPMGAPAPAPAPVMDPNAMNPMMQPPMGAPGVVPMMNQPMVNPMMPAPMAPPMAPPAMQPPMMPATPMPGMPNMTPPPMPGMQPAAGPIMPGMQPPAGPVGYHNPNPGLADA